MPPKSRSLPGHPQDPWEARLRCGPGEHRAAPRAGVVWSLLGTIAKATSQSLLLWAPPTLGEGTEGFWLCVSASGCCAFLGSSSQHWGLAPLSAAGLSLASVLPAPQAVCAAQARAAVFSPFPEFASKMATPLTSVNAELRLLSD